ncbi:hypothetical protein CU043_04955 [Corynebacterium striatum]|nr:hypothetical protein [Corynebacterium striatum]
MTTVSPKKGHDSGKVNEISEKLMGNPELPMYLPPLPPARSAVTLASPPWKPEEATGAQHPTPDQNKLL